MVLNQFFFSLNLNKLNLLDFLCNINPLHQNGLSLATFSGWLKVITVWQPSIKHKTFFLQRCSNDKVQSDTYQYESYITGAFTAITFTLWLPSAATCHLAIFSAPRWLCYTAQNRLNTSVVPWVHTSQTAVLHFQTPLSIFSSFLKKNNNSHY